MHLAKPRSAADMKPAGASKGRGELPFLGPVDQKAELDR